MLWKSCYPVYYALLAQFTNPYMLYVCMCGRAHSEHSSGSCEGWKVGGNADSQNTTAHRSTKHNKRWVSSLLHVCLFCFTISSNSFVRNVPASLRKTCEYRTIYTTPTFGFNVYSHVCMKQRAGVLFEFYAEYKLQRGTRPHAHFTTVLDTLPPATGARVYLHMSPLLLLP